MLQQSTFKFLKDLKKNNNKPWFDKNRGAYENAKADFEEFITDVLAKLAKTEPAFKELKAKDCIFRIYRDVRFSKDKTPYKAHFAAAFSKGGKKHMAAGYYIHLEPGSIFLGGGMWMPEPDALKKIRQEIDYNFKDFQKIVNGASFKKTFNKLSEEDKLKTLPKGYEANNPAIEYLKLKSFVASCKMDDKDIMDKNGAAKCEKIYSAMKPLIDFLNVAAAD
jgi:uncharacterized protein (TIGR02453 family)